MMSSVRKALRIRSPKFAALDNARFLAETVNLPQELDVLYNRAEKQHQSQDQSPLFSLLPPEIRNEVFLLAVRGYEDMSKAYNRETYYWRPGCRAPRRNDLALLRTCKRIWLETRPLPLTELAETALSFFVAEDERRPPESKDKSIFQTEKTRKFLRAQWQAIETIQIFLQGITETNIQNFFHHDFLCPSTIILTTRYTDWMCWEIQHELFLDNNQMSIIRLPSSINKVVMEFEMIQSRETELRRLLGNVFARASKYVWHTSKGTELHIINQEEPWTKVVEWTWEGPTRFEPGQHFDHHPKGDTMTYVVKAVTWKSQKADTKLHG